MISDIRVSVMLRRHRKRRKLEKLLGPGAIGYLIDLWIATAISRPDGILEGWTARDIAEEVDWSDEPEKLLKSLQEAGWIDRRDDGIVIIHDWRTHQGWASSTTTRSVRARINGMIKHHGREAAFRIAREKYGINPEEYGYVLLQHTVADATAEHIACGQHAIADAIAEPVACQQHAIAAATAYAPSPSPSPLPSPSRKNDSKESGSAGSSKSAKRHFSCSAPEYAQAIKGSCLKVKERCNGSRRFNPFQWAQHWINKAGHPQAVVDSLEGLLQFWDTVRGEPWAYCDRIMKTKSSNYYERDEAAKSQGYKQMLCELAGMLGDLPSVGGSTGPSG